MPKYKLLFSNSNAEVTPEDILQCVPIVCYSRGSQDVELVDGTRLFRTIHDGRYYDDTGRLWNKVTLWEVNEGENDVYKALADIGFKLM